MSGAGGVALAQLTEFTGAQLRMEPSIYVLGVAPHVQANNQVLEVRRGQAAGYSYSSTALQ